MCNTTTKESYLSVSDFLIARSLKDELSPPVPYNGIEIEPGGLLEVTETFSYHATVLDSEGNEWSVPIEADKLIKAGFYKVAD